MPDLTDDDWRQLARERAVPPRGAPGDLEALTLSVAPEREAGPDEENREKGVKPEPYIERRTDWLRR